ncbi:MAG TPA: hypothetical protein VF152_13800 [Acidimicrobiia bacterium]
MAQSFLEVARELIDSPEAKTRFASDPPGFLAARGFDGFSPEELEEAVGFVADAVPAPVARQLAEPAAPGAPEPAALARMASAGVAEEAVRDAEPGTIDLAAVVDPGGELEVEPSVALTSVTTTVEESEQPDEQEPEASQEPRAATDDLAGPTDADAPAPGEPSVDEDGAPGPDDGEETPAVPEVEQEAAEPFAETLEPAGDAGLGDMGVPGGTALPPAGTVEEPPAEDITIDDLI